MNFLILYPPYFYFIVAVTFSPDEVIPTNDIASGAGGDICKLTSTFQEGGSVGDQLGPVTVIIPFSSSYL